MSTVKCEWRVETFVIDDLIHQVDYRLAEWLNKLANEVVEPDYFFLEKLVALVDQVADFLLHCGSERRAGICVKAGRVVPYRMRGCGLWEEGGR